MQDSVTLGPLHIRLKHKTGKETQNQTRSSKGKNRHTTQAPLKFSYPFRAPDF